MGRPSWSRCANSSTKPSARIGRNGKSPDNSSLATTLHSDWWAARIPRQQEIDKSIVAYSAKQSFPQMILENLKTAGVQQAHKEDRIACAFNYEVHATEFSKLGRILVFKAR